MQTNKLDYKEAEAERMKNVAIIDDEADTLLLYKIKIDKNFSQNQNVKLLYFQSAQEFIRFFNDPVGTKISLIISDINMPEISGFDLLKEIRKSDPHVIFYLISAFAPKEFPPEANELNVQRYFNKPVDFVTFFEALRSDLSPL